ncbi:MAG: DUF3137 domain-containing protein [Erythrobacter sp.]|uniref:DUF3137 domain-containing protein n=1 Tax=Erythrobacter sp. TaxID=1042 RepID=UPI0032679284
MQYPDPDEILTGELGDWLEWVDGERRAATRKGLWRLALILPVLWIAILVDIFGFDGEWQAIVVLGLPVTGLIFFWAQLPGKALFSSIKTELNTQIAKELELEYQAHPSSNFAFDCGTYFSLLPHHDRSFFESLWIGEFEGRAFELIEVHLQKEHQRKNRRSWRTVFRGALLSIETRSQFSGATLIRQKCGIRDWTETYVVDGPPSPIALGMDPVATGNALFDEHFECHSEDPEEARRLVTSDVMNEIGRLTKRFGSRSISAVFHDRHFAMFIESGNLFESGSYSKSTDRERVEIAILQFATIAEACRAV